MTTRYTDVSTQRAAAENGIEYAYRDLGDGDVPLVLLQHFRGSLDNWDPALVDALAATRRVVAFDNVGVAGTTGRTPNTIEAMAHGAIDFLETMSFPPRRPARLLHRELRRPGDRAHPPRPAPACRARVGSTAGCRGHARLGAGRDRRGWSAGGQPAGLPRGLLRADGHEPRRGARGHGTHLRPDHQPRRSDDLADAPGTVRRGLRLGYPEPLAARASCGDRSSGLRGQRRPRPDDPAPLLAPAGGPAPGRTAHHVPGFGAGFLFQHASRFAADVHAFLTETG